MNEIFDPFSADFRSFDTASIIEELRNYLQITETQMEKVFQAEKQAHDTGFPKRATQEDYDFHCQLGDLLERRFEEDLIPAMRYSFVVLVHIVFENHLRRFCSEIRKDKNLPLPLSKIIGDSIEKSHTYLSKLAGFSVENLPEW